MVAFRIRGKFASFRDPFTISQNVSFPIPPKTTVAGMLASILGIEDYLRDESFFDFDYSVISLSPVHKKSFSQNYINDYTVKTQTQINNIKKGDYQKIMQGLRDKKNPQKPINRELLIDPDFLIFVKGFKDQEKLIDHLKEKKTLFPFYLGNSEFLGSFESIKIKSCQQKIITEGYVDSFVRQEDAECIEFGEGVRYSNLTFATKLNQQRSPLSFADIVFANRPILVKGAEAIEIQTASKYYNCQFV